MNRYRSLKFLSRLASVLLAIAAGNACGSDVDLQWHGALTQGAIYTSDNNFYGPSNDGVSLQFTEMNLNASARVMPKLRVAGQLLYRHAGAQTEGGGVDYLFLDYQLLETKSFLSNVRVGRIKVPLGLYNETRDIAFTRPSIFLPQSGYPDIARDLEISGDGALISNTLFTNTGQWNSEVLAGKPRIDQKTVNSLFGFIPGEISDIHAHSSLGARLSYQSSDSAWTAALSGVDVHLGYMLNAQIDLDMKFNYWIASLQYDIDQWTISGELGQMNVHIDDRIGGVSLGTSSLAPETYHLQITRQLNTQWSAYTRWDNLYWDRKDKGGAGWSQLSGEPNYGNYAHDYLLGARYDIRSDMMISAEYHFIEGTSWLSRYDNAGKVDVSKYWNMLALEFSYRF